MDKDNLKVDDEYIKAHKKVKMLRGFYLHIFAFILISITMILCFLFIEVFNNTEFLRWLLATIIITWAVGLLIHGWSILGTRLIFNKDWEDKKIKKYLQDEDEVWE